MYPWAELGLEPGAAGAEIRRAYAARLKTIRQDEDPEGFQRLRAAYEAALAIVVRPGPAAARPTVPTPPSERDPPAPAPTGPVDEEADAAIRGVVAVFRSGDGDAAATTLSETIAANRLPMAAQMALAEQLVLVLLRDPSLGPERLRQIGRQFGWYDVPAGMRGRNRQAEEQLCARIDAGLWLEELRRKARVWRFWLGGNEAGAARLLLGRGMIGPSWLLPPEPPLSTLAAQLSKHRHWIGAQFDERRLKRVERFIARPRDRFRLIGWAVYLVSCSAVLALLARLGWSATGFPLILVFWALRGFIKVTRPLAVAAIALVLAVSLIAVMVPDPSASLRVGSPGLPSDIGGLRQLLEAGIKETKMQLGADLPAVEDWFAGWAEKGNAADQYNLGLMYLNGSHVERNDGEAAKLWGECQARNPQCVAGLAFLYETGRGVPQDLFRARELYRRAAERGDLSGQLSCAGMAYAGRGGPRDLAEAFHWMNLAAVARNIAAMNYLGQFYRLGLGVARDPNLGLAWLQDAADSGAPHAMLTIAQRIIANRWDIDEAYRWLALSVRLLPSGSASLPAARAALATASARIAPDRRAVLDRAAADWRAPETIKLPDGTEARPADPAESAIRFELRPDPAER